MSLRLIVVDPGHFHCALVQKEMYPNVDPTVHVYAPVGPDLLDYLDRIVRFNTRAEAPTRWRLEVHAGEDFLDRLARERPGDVAVFSGRNAGKIQRIAAAIDAGLNVLADKPWIIRAEDLPLLEQVLRKAQERGLIAYDLMTGRHDVMNIVQAALHADSEVFGEQLAGSPVEPGVAVDSVHHILKQVAGAPNPRPPWFFDVAQQGVTLSDIGTHLIDRVHLTLFPDQAIDRAELRILGGERWSTAVRAPQFTQVTGTRAWPEFLAPHVHDDVLEYPCNSRLLYHVRGVHVAMEMRWDWESAGGDTHTAVYRGSRARIELRQGPAQGWRPELFVVPQADIGAALQRRIAALAPAHPGLAAERSGGEWHVAVPDALRIGHDAHFAALARKFLDHVEYRRPLPAWERPNMLAKYWLCTEGVARAVLR